LGPESDCCLSLPSTALIAGKTNAVCNLCGCNTANGCLGQGNKGQQFLIQQMWNAKNGACQLAN